jgi:geranylgeranyl diphosphate synthase type II
LRRGKPTSHKKYGEALAILAGDALITLAFEILSCPEFTRNFPLNMVMAVIRDVAQASGSTGLIAGQVWDMWFEGRAADEDAVNRIMLNKTAALIRASLTSGARLAGANHEELEIFSRFGEKLGMAFQIKDDLLDIEGDPRRLGKNVKKDGKRGKASHPSVFGAKASKNVIEKLLSESVEVIEPFGEKAQTLRSLTDYIGQRLS